MRRRRNSPSSVSARFFASVRSGYFARKGIDRPAVDSMRDMVLLGPYSLGLCTVERNLRQPGA